MRKILFFAMLFTIYITVTAHGHTPETDGLHQHYDDDGLVLLEVNYKNLKKEGLQKKYYKNGQLKSESFYEEGNNIGATKMYYPNGQLRIRMLKKEEWQYIKAYNQDGKLIEESEQKSEGGEILDGFMNIYDGAGHLTSETIYAPGKQIYRSYKDKKRLWYEKIYTSSNKSKTEKFFYRNGNVKAEDIYKDGVIMTKRRYDEDGSMISEEIETQKSVAMAKEKLRKLAEATETYRLANGKWPTNINLLTEGVMPYLSSTPICNETLEEYRIDCIFQADGYEFTAVPLSGQENDRTLKMTTGKVLSEY